MDPSDLLVALCGLEGDEQQLLMKLILDYQGGGLASTPQQVSFATRIPSAEYQADMGETAKSIIEGLLLAPDRNLGHGVAHGIFVTSMWDLLGMESDQTQPIHRAISGGTINAVEQLVRAERLEDALYVSLLGQCFYMNASDWAAITLNN
jgi:hypothetical protein